MRFGQKPRFECLALDGGFRRPPQVFNFKTIVPVLGKCYHVMAFKQCNLALMWVES